MERQSPAFTPPLPARPAVTWKEPAVPRPPRGARLAAPGDSARRKSSTSGLRSPPHSAPRRAVAALLCRLLPPSHHGRLRRSPRRSRARKRTQRRTEAPRGTQRQGTKGRSARQRGAAAAASARLQGWRSPAPTPRPPGSHRAAHRPAAAVAAQSVSTQRAGGAGLPQLCCCPEPLHGSQLGSPAALGQHAAPSITQHGDDLPRHPTHPQPCSPPR